MMDIGESLMVIYESLHGSCHLMPHEADVGIQLAGARQ